MLLKVLKNNENELKNMQQVQPIRTFPILNCDQVKNGNIFDKNTKRLKISRHIKEYSLKLKWRNVSEKRETQTF